MHGGFPDHNPRSMIDKKGDSISAPGCISMPVFSWAYSVMTLGNNRHSKFVKNMGQAVNGDAVKSRIRENNFLHTGGGRIEAGNGFRIANQLFKYLRKPLEKTWQ